MFSCRIQVYCASMVYSNATFTTTAAEKPLISAFVQDRTSKACKSVQLICQNLVAKTDFQDFRGIVIVPGSPFIKSSFLIFYQTSGNFFDTLYIEETIWSYISVLLQLLIVMCSLGNPTMRKKNAIYFPYICLLRYVVF